MNLTQNTKKLVLLGGDITILYISLYLTLIVRYSWPFENGLWEKHFNPFTVVFLIWLIVFYIFGLYETTKQRNILPFYTLLGKTIGVNAVIVITFFYSIPNLGISPKRVLIFYLIISTILIYVWRRIYNSLLRSKAAENNILIIGINDRVKEIIDHIKKNPQLGYRVKTIINDENKNTDDIKGEKKIINGPDFDLSKIIKEENIQTVVNSIDHRYNQQLTKQLYQNLSSKLSFFDLPTFYEELIGKIPVNLINEIWFLENLQENKKNIHETFKRLMDIILSVLGLIISIPLLPLLAVAIKLDSRGPIFFTQTRTGKDNKKFLAMKLRTMIDGAEKNGAQWAKENDSRITKLGNFLRKTRIDEIPQLLNVLRGEMSFIGPRPERPEFITTLEEHIPFYKQRLIVKPGLTGWAQINFPYGASIEDAMEKMQYDLFYIKNRSIILDISIILKTVNTVLRGGGR
ncbi:sugar transferase [Candidatus Falkowbacteria bacterium]|jgi:exopolysaccharide biosynthesis polyprenyl glycosylphosphotransferase|nr:sugar transferase [Candidatus Falkowbacteria bacterium]MBT4433221.1 sugar transferase [Candidatus Falkowbacteria bacterium]